MNETTKTKALCAVALPMGAFAHVCMFYIGGPLDYRIVGAGAVVCGVLGATGVRKVNRKMRGRRVSNLYSVAAILGALVGLFYASMIGPFIVFFPAI